MIIPPEGISLPMKTNIRYTSFLNYPVYNVNPNTNTDIKDTQFFIYLGGVNEGVSLPMNTNNEDTRFLNYPVYSVNPNTNTDNKETQFYIYLGGVKDYPPNEYK